MKSYRPLLFVVGTLLLLIAAAALISNRSWLAQESTPEAPAPPEQTTEPIPEVIPPTALPTATTIPIEVIILTPTTDTNSLILTATAQSLVFTPAPPNQVLPEIILSTDVAPPLNTAHTTIPGMSLDPSITVDTFTFPDLPTNYRIVYFIAPDRVADSSFISSANLFVERSHALVASSWEEVIQLDGEAPIEVFVVHQSAYDLLDFEWTAAAARRGVVLAVVNLYFAEMVNLQNNNCGRQQAATIPENPYIAHNVDYFMIDSFVLLTGNPLEQPLAEAVVYDTCTPNPAIKSRVFTFGLVSNGDVTTQG